MCQHVQQLKSADDFATISEYVAAVREVRGYTLQEVVDLVADAVRHNTLPKSCSLTKGYLSCLEAGKFTHPSPFKLQALAHVYRIPYESLLQKAGYLQTTDDK